MVHALTWTAAASATTPTGLGTLGGTDSTGNAINNSGLVAGSSDLPNTDPYAPTKSHAFRWTPFGGM